jgi:hypothetical protein
MERTDDQARRLAVEDLTMAVAEYLATHGWTHAAIGPPTVAQRHTGTPAAGLEVIVPFTSSRRRRGPST